MAFCYQCGKPISEQAKFCPYCGYNITPKVVVAKPEVHYAPKGKKEKVKKGKGKKGKHDETEVFAEEFAQGSAVEYSVEHKPTETVTAPQSTPTRTVENPMPARDAETNVPSLSQEPVEEDRFGWVWIAVGVVILLIVLVVIWFLLFSGYY